MTEIEDYEIREGSLTFFYNIAGTIGEKFEQLFDKLIEFTLKSASEKDADEKDYQPIVEDSDEDNEIII